MLGSIKKTYDLIIVGGGPAGMAAALSAQSQGVESILMVERDNDLGGILLQCIHAGFGIHVFKEELTGPEYAYRYLQKVLEEDIDYLTDCFVTHAQYEEKKKYPLSLHLRKSSFGLQEVEAKSIILAMGCRERTRQAIHIPGSRPSGIMTAGLAQKMVNIHRMMPGSRVVILGSGDIGLIMARRLALEGAEVLGVHELMPYSNGLTRNIVQCLNDYDIPLHLSTTVTRVYGDKRLESIDVCNVDEHLNPIESTKMNIPCDTLLLSVGLIPEIEIARMLGVQIHPVTQGPIVDSHLQTNIPSVFACGNVLHVHDLADNVSQEAERAGKSAALRLREMLKPDDIVMKVGENISYCVPQTLQRGQDHMLSFRVRRPCRDNYVQLGNALRRKLPLAIPSEMIHIKVTAAMLEKVETDTLELSIQA